MSKLTYRASYYVLYALFAAILVVLGMFFLGGEMEEPLVYEMSNPKHTDTLLYLLYGLLGFTIVVTLVAAIFQFGAALKDNAWGAIKSLLGVILFFLLLVVTWNLGSGEELEIVGYEGSENVPFYLKMTDMFLYSLYFLMTFTVVAMLFSGIKKRLS
ncbi:hypothetical protein D0T50_10930 [Bacteroides sp. 214]|uniref:hypothetical protein n=1 Tax=Bacteroides sp. 214 TaxID=2302935 RepID=UPI0013D55D4F|nr:hypothetical protein [Bacteroides sp. 214]NDW13403.1 hypothetical protein [Bacteroides sp. 214]